MKKLILPLMMLLCITVTRATDLEKYVKSDITEVKVFLSGAQVYSHGVTTVDAGVTYLIFDQLSPFINASSVQAKGKGDFTILSVTHQQNYLRNKPKPKDILQMEDSLEMIQRKIDYENSMIAVYKVEEEMIIANKAIGGTQTGVKIADLAENANFFRTRLTDIKTKVMECQQKIRKHNEVISKLTSQLSLYNASQNKSTSEIIVGVSAKIRTQVDLTLNYLVMNAGWVPVYDLRADDNTGPIQLTYKANVYQTTGFDWNNVKISLSTGNPTLSGSKPIVYPWFVSFYTPYNYSYRNEGLKTKSAAMDKKEANAPTTASGAYAEFDKIAETTANYTQVNEGQTTVEFDISIPYTVPSNGKTYGVEIQIHKLPALYQYYAAPKLDPDAFLLARVTGWENLNLMPGESNIYFEGTYVGKSYIDPRSTKDTLEFSFGRDKNIVVSRQHMKDFSAKQFIGANKKETTGWEISVRNKKKTPIEIVIEDQIPLTTDKDIEITADDISGAKLNKETGILSWKFNIATAETKKFKLVYTLKYPKDKTVN
jgi:uncharacterized protein (TIGR02231 family)